MTPKKIFLNSNMVWTISQFRLGLIRELIGAGYEVVCAADTDSFSALSETKLIAAGARFIRLPVSRKGVNPFADLHYLYRLHRVLKKERPDMIINYTVKPIVYGSIAARLLHIPSFAVTTGLGFVFTRNNLLTRFIKLLYRLSLRYPARVFFLNQDDLDDLARAGLISREKAFILPGEGIDTAYYHPISKFDPSEPFTFLLIARLLKEKGVVEYIRAARMLKASHGDAVECWLIGHVDDDNPGGISREQLNRWVGEGMVTYLGTSDDVRPYIADADCVVLPSYRIGVPRTLMEAAAMAKPIVATNCIGCREVVDNGKNGYLCKPRDVNDLYNKMVDMLTLSDQERALMGTCGREKMLTQFDEKIVINQYFKEIEALWP